MIVEGTCYTDLQPEACRVLPLKPKSCVTNRRLRYQMLPKHNRTQSHIGSNPSTSLLDTYVHNYRARVSKESSTCLDQSTLLKSFCEEGLVQVLRRSHHTLQSRPQTRGNEKNSLRDSVCVVNRPKISITPIEIKQAAGVSAVYLPKRSHSANMKLGKRMQTIEPRYTEKSRQLSRSRRKQISLNNSILQSCCIKKKEISNRIDPLQTISSPIVEKRDCLHALRVKTRAPVPKQLKMGKRFDIGAWEVHTNEWMIS